MSEAWYRYLPLALVFVAAIALSPKHVAAQETKYKVGDEISYEWARTTYTGKVTEVLSSGWLKIEVKSDGRDVVWTVPPNRVTLVKPKFEHEFRQWTDDSGEFSVRARLIEQTDETVKLKKEDDRVVTVPLKKLGAEDQDYLAQLRRSTDKNNPFAGGVFENEDASGQTRGFHMGEPISQTAVAPSESC